MFECIKSIRTRTKDLEPFITAMYRKLEPFVVLTSNLVFRPNKYMGMFLYHFDLNKSMGTFSV